jgi:hypothetical protein
MFEEYKRRRGFIKTLLSSAATLLTVSPFSKTFGSAILTLEPRTRLPNPYVTNDGQPILVYVTAENYQQALGMALNELGGLGLLVNNIQDVLSIPERCRW